MEAEENVPTDTELLLVTANVGSLFEDPERLLTIWLEEFFAKISQVHPKFIALHLQEVGGKTYEKSMECVQEFIRRLCDANVMTDYIHVRIYMDEDFQSPEHFTALGNVYFAHRDIENIRIWNFLTHVWEEKLNQTNDKHIYSGNIETIPTKEKSKFPQHFFPECKWSRKGFMRTRWEINNTVFDLVNIHLFHDASNLAACEDFPSVYCKTRRRALVHTIERFHLDDKNGTVPFFLFGDFNFRCDTEGVVKELTQNLTAHRVQSMKSDNNKIHYRNTIGNNVLTVGKKEFSHADHQLKFKEDWLKNFDRELEPLKEILVEYPISFVPSYPFEEDPEMPTDYMSTRCPAWCDRILMSPQVSEIIQNDDWDYNMIGESICMGDHKPIYLTVRLKPNKGTYRSCDCNYTCSCANNNNNSASAVPIAKCKYCPYSNTIYKDVVNECKILADTAHKSSVKIQHNSLKIRQDEDAQGGNSSRHPAVSINVIDSDNICVCMCAHLSSSNPLSDESNGETIKTEPIEGTICPLCCNMIKQQPVTHRYRLLSKRVVLSEDIIVNRIDTQHLSTYYEHAHDDPYTPDSDSHSPYPEVPSTSTTTSSNSRSPFEHRLPRDDSGIDECHEKYTPTKAEIVLTNNPASEKQSRGAVTPGQLKSRLEDLQRLSIHNQDENDPVMGKGDVDQVEAICTPNAVPTRPRRNSSVFPMCCNIH
ncbi:inositol polyphosphate-5-phosphatase A isoform X1 [Drosophila tropicalis]|uniref:inositol polyphosphate-5-phosphatase A isoform X1 n=1 Tax=Drosophila tropicalis TaxID=46794 RepID=UPI0035AB965F